MSKKANPALIGLFVVGAAALAVAAAVVLGSGKLFRETRRAVTYFDGSVVGLQAGSGVVFRGVPIGAVTEVVAVVDRQSLEIQIPVVLELYPDSMRIAAGADAPRRPFEETMAELVSRGLRSKLIPESLVTGQLLVELDFRPGAPEVYRAPKDGEYPEIPSVSSDLQQIQGMLEEVAVRFRELPLEDLTEKASSLLAGLDELVRSDEVAGIVSGADRLINSEDTQALTADLRAAVGKLDGLLEDAGQLVRDADAGLEPVLEKLPALVERIDGTLAEAEGLLSAAGPLVGEDSELLYRANATLEETQRAMRSLRVFLDFLEQHPEAMLRGKANRR